MGVFAYIVEIFSRRGGWGEKGHRTKRNEKDHTHLGREMALLPNRVLWEGGRFEKKEQQC